MLKPVVVEDMKLQRIQRGHFTPAEAAAFDTPFAMCDAYPATVAKLTPAEVEILWEKMRKVVATNG